MKNIITIFIIIAGFSASVHADSMKGLLDHVKDRNKKDMENVRVSERGDKPREHTIDPYRVERASKEQSYIEVCKGKKFPSFNAEYKCFSDARDKFNSDYPDRGTHQYGEKYYFKLSPQEGREKREELLKLLDLVSYFPKPGNEKGEITVEHLKKEIFYIERYVMKINPREYETR